MFSFIKSYIDPLSFKEKLINVLAGTIAILLIGITFKFLPHQNLTLPLIASIGASTFLLFVVPHSPMSQPWPLIGGHLLSAISAVAVIHLTDDLILASACSVGASILVMQFLKCLHPPAAATALAVIAGAQTHAMGIQFIIYVVLSSMVILLAIAYVFNRILLKRRYPLMNSHHPFHTIFQNSNSPGMLKLEISDIEWALVQMDGIVDASKEDLIDIYELAQQCALSRGKSDVLDGTGR